MVPRSTCYRCFRPMSLCYCALVPRVVPKRNVTIVQHHREEFHPLNTARMLELSLEGCEILRGNNDRLEELLEAREFSEGTALLFPSSDAEDIEVANERIPITEIVAVDGTWDQAKTLLRLKGLAGLRRVRFTPKIPSQYRIRKEPKLDYLSTLESIALVLEALEPETNVDALRELFRNVIDKNIEARPAHSTEIRMKMRGKGRVYRFPDFVRYPESVVAYGESAMIWSEKNGLATEPLILELARPGTRGALDRLGVVLRTSGEPREKLLGHLGLTSANVAAGLSFAAAREIVGEFIGNQPIVVWSSTTKKVLRALGIESDVELLKGHYCDYRTGRERRAGREIPTTWGSLNEILEREGLEAVPADNGRATRRVLETERLLRHFRALALETERAESGLTS